MKSSFFVPKSRKTYGCEMPALAAIVLGAAAVEPVLGELDERRVEHGLAALLGRLPLRRGCHGSKLALTYFHGNLLVEGLLLYAA